MTEKIIGIYIIKNLKNGKVYVGQSRDIYRRWKEHKNELNKNKHCNVKLQNAWNKYGSDAFSFIIQLECGVDDLNNNEKIFVKKYDSYKNGYNMTHGGEESPAILKEVREKISNTKNSYSKEKMKEISKKMIECHEFQAIPIYQLDLDGNIIKRWQSTRFAARELGINQSCIQNCLDLKRKTYKNSIWIRENDYKNFDLSIYKNLKTSPNRILQKNLDGYIIREWPSAYSTKKEGYDDSTVIKCCRGKLDTHKGYKWEYAD